MNVFSNQYPPQQNVSVNVNQSGPSFLIRAIWYIFIGWWLGGLWLSFGYFCCLTGIGIPLGLIILNRLPTVLTLRPVSLQTSVSASRGYVDVITRRVPQVNFLVRFVYFLFIGWWLGAVWSIVGYALCLIILGLPFGLLMLNRLPAVLTLRRQ